MLNKTAFEHEMRRVLVKPNVQGDENSFQGMQAKIIHSFSSFVVDWLTECFTKYPEAEFHKRMSKRYKLVDKNGKSFIITGFDFIQDMRTNHKKRWLMFITQAKMWKKYMMINEQAIANLIELIVVQQGWTLYPEEKEAIKKTFNRLNNIIYHSVDTISL